MAGKPKLYYFNGRGRMETIRWLLAAAGIEPGEKDIIMGFPGSGSRAQFDEHLIETKDELVRLKEGGFLLFQQIPMVEIDGMKLVQTRAILNYIASKYNLYGKDLKERAMIDMYCEGAVDLYEPIMLLPMKPADTRGKEMETIIEKATNIYFPVYEKVFKEHGQDFLVGKQLSRADIQLFETILVAEEMKPDILSKFSSLKAFKTRMSNIPTIKKFLQPGSPRKPPMDEESLAKAIKIFH